MKLYGIVEKCKWRGVFGSCYGMYQNILVPVDGSEYSQRAIEEAVSLANELEATIHALSVADTVHQRDQLRSDPEEEAAKWLDDVEARADRLGVPVVRAIDQGVPDEKILDYADKNEIDAIVMGTKGRTGVNRVLLGSVAEEVIRHSSVPVMTVRPEE